MPKNSLSSPRIKFSCDTTCCSRNMCMYRDLLYYALQVW